MCHLVQDIPELEVSEEERKSRCEAAAKVAANRDATRARLTSHSGVVRVSGSPFGETIENVNGMLLSSALAIAMFKTSEASQYIGLIALSQ